MICIYKYIENNYSINRLIILWDVLTVLDQAFTFLAWLVWQLSSVLSEIL